MDEHEDGVAGVDDLLDLDVPLLPRGAPVLDPAPPAVVPEVLALVRRLVVVHLDRLGYVVPDRLAGRREVLEPALDGLDVRLGHGTASIHRCTVGVQLGARRGRVLSPLDYPSRAADARMPPSRSASSQSEKSR